MKRPKLKLVKGFATVPQPQEPPDSFEAAITRFIAARSAVTKRVQIQYRRVISLYRRISPDWPPEPDNIATFIEYCQEHYEPVTTHTYYGILRNFINFAVKRRLIEDDPLDSVTAPRRPGVLPRAPDLDDLKKLTAHLEREVEKVLAAKQKPYKHWGWHKVRNLALFSLMLDSGLRVSEAVNVRLQDIYLEEWYIFVRRGKGNKQREVPFGRTTRGDLKLWLDHRSLIPIPVSDPGFSYLFISHRRGWQPMAAAHAEMTLDAICQKAGIEPVITPHQLRHAFASLSHAGGAPIGRIQQWLGHSDPGITTRYLMTREGLRDHLKSSPRDHQV